MEIRVAEVVIGCRQLDETLRFFTERLGFRVDTIMPADDPSVAVISGHGVRLRIERGDRPPGALRVRCDDVDELDASERHLTAPNGTEVELIDGRTPLEVPDAGSSFTSSRAGDDAAWVVGRAGMRYRDLIPGRQGGRFIASHIQLGEGGPVPDDVHHHRIRFQAIYCVSGSIRVVYEDQGPPFALTAGDCVLQPPGIRHRVLESSAGAEVVEIGCPAEHETSFDHDLDLPTATVRPDRDFGGQRFVHHRAEGATWRPWRIDGFECRDTGIGRATDGLAGIRVVRRSNGVPCTVTVRHEAELAFAFVLSGELDVAVEGELPLRLSRGDAIVLPSERPCTFEGASPDLEVLDVTLPDAVAMEQLS